MCSDYRGCKAAVDGHFSACAVVWSCNWKVFITLPTAAIQFCCSNQTCSNFLTPTVAEEAPHSFGCCRSEPRTGSFQNSCVSSVCTLQLLLCLERNILLKHLLEEMPRIQIQTLLFLFLVWFWRFFVCVCFCCCWCFWFFVPLLAPGSCFLIGDEIPAPELWVPPCREDPCSDAAWWLASFSFSTLSYRLCIYVTYSVIGM